MYQRAELGTRFFWVFAHALSRCQRIPFVLFFGLKFRAFALLFSFRAPAFLSPTCVCKYTLRITYVHTPHTFIHPHTHICSPTPLHTSPHTYIHPYVHPHIHRRGYAAHITSQICTYADATDLYLIGFMNFHWL